MEPATRRYRALIAVVAYHLAGDRVARWPDGGYGVPAPYLDALRRAGARTAIVSPGEEGDPEELLEPFDGLLLVGGGDVDPARYGAEPDTEHNYGVEPDRDAFEIALLQRRRPTAPAHPLHLPRDAGHERRVRGHAAPAPARDARAPPARRAARGHRDAARGRRPNRGTLLSATTKSGPLACSSHHHQGVDRVGDGTRRDGTQPRRAGRGDRAPEAPTGTTPSTRRGCSACSGTRRRRPPTDPAQQSLFDAFVNLARLARPTRAAPASPSGRSREYGLADPTHRGPTGSSAEADADRRGAAGRARRADRPRRLHVGAGLAGQAVSSTSSSRSSRWSRATPTSTRSSRSATDWAPDGYDDTHEFFSLGRGRRRARREPPRDARPAATGSGGIWPSATRSAPTRRPRPRTRRSSGDLAAAHPRDIVRYVQGKSDFIRAVEDRAAERGGLVPDNRQGRTSALRRFPG